MARVASFTKQLSPESSLQILEDLALHHIRQISDVPLKLHLGLLVRGRHFRELVMMDPDYSTGVTLNDITLWRQVLAFYSKLEPLDIGEDKTENARVKFMESEVSCLKANRRFNSSVTDETEFSQSTAAIIEMARVKISKLLGDAPPLLDDLEYFFGPGATTSVTRRISCARTKLSALPSSSDEMLPLVSSILDQVPMYRDLHLDESGDNCLVEVHFGKLSFVPKNAKTYRSICTEPTLNALAQSAVGRFISKRLLSVGVDLRDQTRNKNLARLGSITGELATLDLSSASDSICIELVAALLPYEWFALLSLIRTGTVRTPDGGLLRLHKFSSMGNGFTFPLESLIFWALSASVVERFCSIPSSEMKAYVSQNVGIYGDDIIVPVSAVSPLIDVFTDVGFEVNKSKSHWQGPFRESCGGDYFNGFDIRPWYCKDWFTGETLFQLHNFYWRHLDFASAKIVEALIDSSLRLYGPDGFGDGHLLSDAPLRHHKRSLGWAGFVFETYTRKPRYHFTVMPGDAVLPAYSAYEREFAPAGSSAAPTLHRRGPQGHDDWYPVVRIPGSHGIRLISIYTLSPA